MTMNNSSVYPVIMPLMNPQEFQSCLTAQKQNCLLYDSEQIKEELAQDRRLTRDTVKSNLRKEEFSYKQKIQLINRDFFVRQGAVWMQDINGAGQRVREVCVLSCVIRSVRKYSREERDDRLFQMIIEDGKSEISSILYEAEVLESPLRLQRTILCHYDKTCSQQDKTVVWRWVWKMLVSMYDEAETYCLPALPGWHNEGEHYHFWAGNRSSDVLMNKEIRRYKLRYTEESEITKIHRLFEQKGADDEEMIGTLLLIRLIALTGRLCTVEPIPITAILYGDSALPVAKELLSVSATEDNIINLESDRLNVIRKKIVCLRENVAIFTLHSVGNRTTRNRISDVCSWMLSGYVEGNKVTVPYVFCLEKLSPDIPFANSVLIDADSISSKEWEQTFTIVQSWWIDMIEKSGMLIAEQLQAAVRQKRTERKAFFECIAESIVEEIDGLMSCNHEVGEKFISILQSGMRLMKSQMLMQYDYILNTFRSQVMRLSESRQIAFSNCTNTDSAGKESIYYDEDYYYFTDAVLKWICNKSKIDTKSLLAVKRQLVSLKLVRIYRNDGRHNRELQIDIPIRNKNGEKRYISAFAIKRSFWDKDFGLCLYEGR